MQFEVDCLCELLNRMGQASWIGLLCSCADLIRWEGLGTQKCSSSFICYQPATIENVNILLNERLKPFSSNILLHDWSRLLARCIKFGLWTDIPWRSDLQSSLAKWLAEYRGHALHPGAAENAAGGETAEMIVMPVLISRIKIAMGESEIGDISKDPQRSTAPGLVLQLEQPPRQHHPLLPLSPGASGSEALLRSSAMSVEVRSSTSHHPCHAD